MKPDSPGANLRRIVAAFPAKRVLAIGDLMLDEFIWGKVSRISPEAPVPVVNVTGESYYPGGAANVARNLRELTHHTALIGLLGTDPAGCRLLHLLRDCGIDTSGVQQDAAVRTAVKTRIIARNQQVVRVDREHKTQLAPTQVEAAMEQVERVVPQVDAVVVADYGKGFLSQPLADHICRVARSNGKILAVDPHPHTSLCWPGATAIKPNRAEALLAAGLPTADSVSPPLADAALLDAGRRLLERWQCGLLLITLGDDGMVLLESDGRSPLHIPARAREVFDVSGAGDTAISVLAMALAAGAAPQEAADLANRASGIVVGKLGTATVTPEEIAATVDAL
jgi:D-beta-D-heptose 7-phosphate kinase/D-beta-D-heptose 1-phosphate adenosyltransferase